MANCKPAGRRQTAKKQEVRFPGLPAESADTASSAAPARCSGGYISRLLLDFIGPRSAEFVGFHHSCGAPRPGAAVRNGRRFSVAPPRSVSAFDSSSGFSISRDFQKMIAIFGNIVYFS